MRDNEPEMSLEDLLENVEVMKAQIKEMKVPASCLRLATAPGIFMTSREGRIDCGKYISVRWLPKIKSMNAN